MAAQTVRRGTGALIVACGLALLTLGAALADLVPEARMPRMPPQAPALVEPPLTWPTPGDGPTRALYLTGWTVGIRERREHYVRLAAETELTAYVVDVKDDDGYIGYETAIPEARANAAWRAKYTPQAMLEAFHGADLRVIGRIACFKDPVMAVACPGWALTSAEGKVWRDASGSAWLNPYNRDTWTYLAAVAKEAVAQGFDEIQLDYVRFPSEGHKAAIDYGEVQEPKHEAIAAFLAWMRDQLPGVVVSADVFGIVCESEADTEDIGQYLEVVGQPVAVLSPMVYPSHYARGQVVNGQAFPHPDLEPYAVVFHTLTKALARLQKLGAAAPRLRPYLQDFSAPWLGKGAYQTYGREQVRAQIQAVYDAGLTEWILWNARNRYTEPALEPAPPASIAPGPSTAAAPGPGAPPEG